MNPFLLSSHDRLEDWKEFRKHLKGDDALLLVAKYWAKAPLSKMAYDPENSDDWLSPWEMISAGEWCENSVAIGMEFTLRLAEISNNLKLHYIRDYSNSIEKLILLVDDKYILNYFIGEVINVNEISFDIQGSFKNDGKRYLKV